MISQRSQVGLPSCKHQPFVHQERLSKPVCSTPVRPQPVGRLLAGPPVVPAVGRGLSGCRSCWLTPIFIGARSLAQCIVTSREGVVRGDERVAAGGGRGQR